MPLSQLAPGDESDVARSKINAGLTAVDAETSARNAAIAASASAEATARSTAITNAVSNEASARNTAIGAAVGAEATARNGAIANAVAALQPALDALDARDDDLETASANYGARIVTLEDASQAAQVAVDRVDGLSFYDKAYRPGDTPAAFTLDALNGAPILSAALDPTVVFRTVDGAVVRLFASVSMAQRGYFVLGQDRLFRVGLTLRRVQNSVDPDNDVIRLAVAWYDKDLNRLAVPNHASALYDFSGLVVSDGVQSVAKVVAANVVPGSSADVIAPAGAKYARAFVDSYSATAYTDVLDLGVEAISPSWVTPSLAAVGRPGEMPTGFTIGLASGAPEDCPTLPFANVRVAASDAGRVARISDACVLAQRDLSPVEEARVYLARAVVKRTQDTVDPSGDAVRVGLAWYDGNKALLSQTVIDDLQDFAVADGRTVVETRFGRGASSGTADIAAPSSARYSRLFVQTFGTSNITDVEVLSTDDMSFPSGADLLSVERPGDRPDGFSTVLDGGNPLDLPLIGPGRIVTTAEGAAVSIIGAGIIAQRSLFGLEAGRVYRVRMAVRRILDPISSSNRVLCGVAWYDAQRARLVAPDASATIHDYTSLTAADGHQVASLSLARAAGTGISLVAPSLARYGRLFVQTFGANGVTGIDVVDFDDITDAANYSPDLTTLTSRVTALESLSVASSVQAATGYQSGSSVTWFQMAQALSAATPVDVGGATVNALSFVNGGMPSDIADPATMRWQARRPIATADVVAEKIKSILGLDSTGFASLMGVASGLAP